MEKRGREDYTLEDLLESEDAIQELRNMNPRVLRLYCTRHRRITKENMLAILDFVVQEPPPNADDRRAYKFPFMAAEVLSCEADDVLNAFFNPWVAPKPDPGEPESIAEAVLKHLIDSVLSNMEESKEGMPALEEAKRPSSKLPLLEKLLSVLDAESINPVLSGYFLKVVEVFIERKQLDFLAYVFGFKEYVEKLLAHIYDRHIADAIKKIVSNEDRYFAGTTGNEFIYDKMLVIDKLIDLLDASNPPDSIANSAYILCELIKGKQHLAYFNETRVLKRVFAAVTSKNAHSLCAGTDYLTELLRLNSAGSTAANTDNLYFIGYDNFEQIEENAEEKLDYSELMALAADCLPKFKELLTKREDRKYETQFGARISGFGGDRLRVASFLCELMEIKNDIFCQKFQELAMPATLLQLMQIYYMNTMLHATVCKVFSNAVKSGIAFLVDMVSLCLIV